MVSWMISVLVAQRKVGARESLRAGPWRRRTGQGGQKRSEDFLERQRTRTPPPYNRLSLHALGRERGHAIQAPADCSKCFTPWVAGV